MTAVTLTTVIFVRTWRICVATLLVMCTVFAGVWLFSPSTHAAIPTTLSFQGRLTDSTGALMPDGFYNMQFKIYTVPTGGAASWSETREVSGSDYRVQVTNGLFSTQLGQRTALPTSLFANTDLYFEITMATPATATCNTTACQTWESPMTSRQKLATSAYAFNSDTLDGLDSTAFAAATGSANYIQNTSSPQTANFNITGTGTAGTLQTATLDTPTSGTLTIGSTNTTGIVLGKSTTIAANQSITLIGGTTVTRPASPTEGMLYYDQTTKQLLTYANGKWQSDGKTATKIVAASNSPQAIKDGADYVATGTSDQTVINSALTAAAGGKVYLAEGTYTVNSSISIPNNTTLAGTSNGTMIQFAVHGSNDYMIKNTDQTTGTGITIQDMQLNGRKDIVTTTDFGIYLNHMGSGSGSTTVKGAVLRNVLVENFSFSGIALYASSHNLISQVKVKSNNNLGVYIANGSGSSAFNTVIGANLSDNSNGNIEVVGSDYNIISNNTTSGGWYGVNLNTSADSNIVVGNNVQSTTYGISTMSNTANEITGNVITDSITYGIYLATSDNKISNNLVSNTGGATDNNGIYATSGGSNNVIADNTITDTSCTTTCYAIKLANTVNNTYLADNVFRTSSGTATINDASTTTRYASQTVAQNGADLLFRQSNSTSAFAIQNASSAAILTADTANSKIQIGSATTDGSAVLLVLDSYNNATDPAGVNGAMYYNTSTNKYRCYSNGAWANCNDDIPSAVRAYDSNATIMTIASSGSTYSSVTFDTDLYDPEGMHDTVSDVSRFYAKTAGYYTITGTIRYNSNGMGGSTTVFGRLLMNDVGVIAENSAGASSTDFRTVTVSATRYLNVNDWIQLQARQATGANMNVAGGGDWVTTVEMTRL